MLIVVAGVSGTGKSTIGAKLAEELQLPFFDADDFHPQSNIDKMRGGTPLTDEDRKPWLDELARLLASHEEQKGAVLACSALKESYRQRLATSCHSKIYWIILNGSYELLEQRLSERQSHFFDGKLLESQLATLELPEYGHIINVDMSVGDVVASALKQFP